MTTATFKGAKKFELVSVEPSADTPMTSVDVIRLIFSKEVTVTLPEGGIEVVNNDTKEVIKIASVMENEWLEKTNVIFEFEKKIVTDKDGKEEEQAQYISAPGTYSFTVPAGCIKSVDGDEFADSTFTFSVVGTFELTDWSPRETTELSQIELTFEEEIMDIKMSADLTLYRNWVEEVTNKVVDASVSGNKVTLTLETPITTPGSYDLNIYQGSFVSESGISQYAGIYFTIIDSEPGFETNYKNGDKVKVGELKNFEISFENVETVELKKTEFTVLSLSAQSTITGTAAYSEETGKITVTLSQELTQEGDYVFQIPAGMFTMDGVENEKRDVQINIFTFTIAPLEIVSVTPAVGKVDQIANITITFNQPVQLYYDKEGVTPSSQIVLKSGENEYVLYSNYSNDLTSLIYTTDEWTGTDWAANPITAEGAYTLDLSTIVVNYAAEDGIDEYGYSAKIYHVKNHQLEGTYTWTIGGSDEAAAKFVNAETAEQVIYDLLGRRVEKVTTAGIYIVNGRKVIIK